MITDKARTLRSEFNVVLDLHLRDLDDKQARRKVQLASEELFGEIIRNCNPTEAEFSFLMSQVLMTARMMYWIITWRVDDRSQNAWTMVPNNEFKEKEILPNMGAIGNLALNGLINDGSSHKQWHLEKILEASVPDFEDIRAQAREQGYEWESGIAP